MSRKRRQFHELDRKALLGAVGVCRQATIHASSAALFDKTIYPACDRLKNALDDMAETLTGNREHFWTKPHSTHGNPQGPVTNTAGLIRRIEEEPEAEPKSPRQLTLGIEIY